MGSAGDHPAPVLETERLILRGFVAEDFDAHKAIIERMIAESGARAVTEHYAAAHGWTFPTRWCHDHAAAEHAFAQVLALLVRTLADR